VKYVEFCKYTNRWKCERIKNKKDNDFFKFVFLSKEDYDGLKESLKNCDDPNFDNGYYLKIHNCYVFAQNEIIEKDKILMMEVYEK
jgi:hypothetical protein